ncbi:NAD(P)/FAD-dependent oxidoreductase [Shimia marina]|uniref:NAD(P)/FAD-dependent oxidoreductase n=1 Tax=Shimia marina TaxID=321267 RepID=UPI0008F17415|nr:FAD-dependent oxidoreductase [Shimia marina]SFE82274.1 NADH dehydrogenase [Shimia marina]
MNRIVIIGGGFAGTWAAISAAAARAKTGKSGIDICLISDAAHLSIRPRFYEKPSQDQLVPLQPLMDEIGVRFERGRADEIMGGHVQAEGRSFAYDRLVLCAGSHMPFPAISNAQALGHSVDTFAEARRLDAHLGTLDVSDPSDGTIVVVGASFTGIELVTNLRQRLGKDAKLVVADQAAVAGQSLGANVAPLIAEALSEQEIKVMTNVSLAGLEDGGATFSNGKSIKTSTVIFATGFRASGLTRQLSDTVDTDGRLLVDPDLRVYGQSNIFAAGDVARAKTDEDHSTLMSCQHAMPMGGVAGRNAVLDLLGKRTIPYAQPFYATCLDLGPAGAVFTHGWDRQVQKTGSDGAAKKQEINTKWIYPPSPDIGAAKIFEWIEQSLA